MATFYLVLVIVLFILAFSDLVVGVSNDAVNFLNSAVGAKTASFRIIMSVAAAGVLVGATFSSGMMEVARKGIFHPEYFYFSEIIIIFLAVMVTDVILLDAFNTFGMPTSTTVSIVFELLGAAVAISAVKVFTDPDAMALYDYINSGKALAIIAGILLSVVIAFSCGVITQYFSRLFFSFDYEKRMRQFGAVWGGLGVTGITYFMLIKGVKGASFMSVQAMQSIENHTGLILLGSLVGWTLILFVLNRVFKVDILKVLVLVGTFALAMAFAGNDLVNFIGVPLAGYNSYQLFMESGAGAQGFLMDGLAGQVPTPTLLLLLAGLVMVVTLFLSKKARSVVQTSLDLGRQEEGSERFSSFLVSRSIVRNFAKTATVINDNLPNAWTAAVNRRFDQTPFTTKQGQLGKEAPVFDMIRASVTLAVASILIAIGTNLKLPLSTTYVTFMVFMGTSLADGAWGRESAVYRVSGVLSVIGGWFFTAFSAFTMAFIMAMIFHFGGLVAIAIVLVMAAAVIYRTHRYHHKKMEQQRALEKDFVEETLNRDKLIELCNQQLSKFLLQFSKQVDKSFKGLRAEDLTILISAKESFKQVLEQLSALKHTSHKLLDRIPDSNHEAGHVFLLVVDYLHEMGSLSMSLIQSNLDHVDNYHKPLLTEQIEELISLHHMLEERYHSIIALYQDQSVKDIEKLYKNFNSYINIIRNVRKQQIRRIKNDNVGTRNSRLFLGHLADLRTLGLFSDRIVKVYDELLLNPNLEEEFSADSIRKALSEAN
jgi:phosphate/sulfate permease